MTNSSVTYFVPKQSMILGKLAKELLDPGSFGTAFFCVSYMHPLHEKDAISFHNFVQNSTFNYPVNVCYFLFENEMWFLKMMLRGNSTSTASTKN